MAKQNENKTQEDKVLNHLKTIGPITPIEALNRYGCFRLGARIYTLRQRGHDIVSKSIDVGLGRHVAQYSLKK